jgi:DNA-binding XRE family transcriptional regulator
MKAGKRYAEMLDGEPGLTVAELARREGVKRQAVSSAIRRYDPDRIAGRKDAPLPVGTMQEWRVELGITQIAAAHALGLGLRTVQKYEKKGSVPYVVELAMARVKDQEEKAKKL